MTLAASHWFDASEHAPPDGMRVLVLACGYPQFALRSGNGWMETNEAGWVTPVQGVTHWAEVYEPAPAAPTAKPAEPPLRPGEQRRTLALVRYVPREDGGVDVFTDPAPRCDRCRHWARQTALEADGMVCAILVGRGGRLQPTPGDFGCVRYEPSKRTERTCPRCGAFVPAGYVHRADTNTGACFQFNEETAPPEAT